MDSLVEKLDARLRKWKPEIAAEARERISEIIHLADEDVLDLARLRAAEQEVLDLLDGLESNGGPTLTSEVRTRPRTRSQTYED